MIDPCGMGEGLAFVMNDHHPLPIFLSRATLHPHFVPRLVGQLIGRLVKWSVGWSVTFFLHYHVFAVFGLVAPTQML